MKTEKSDIQYGLETSHEEMMYAYSYYNKYNTRKLNPNDIAFYSIEFGEQKRMREMSEKFEDIPLDKLNEYFNYRLDEIIKAPEFDAESYDKYIKYLNDLDRYSEDLTLDILYRQPYLMLMQPYNLLHKDNESSGYYWHVEDDKFKFMAFRYEELMKEIESRYKKGLLTYDEYVEEIEIMNYNYFESNGIDRRRNEIIANYIIKYKFLPEILNYDLKSVVYNASSNYDLNLMEKKQNIKQKVKTLFKK